MVLQLQIKITEPASQISIGNLHIAHNYYYTIRYVTQYVSRQTANYYWFDTAPTYYGKRQIRLHNY